MNNNSRLDSVGQENFAPVVQGRENSNCFSLKLKDQSVTFNDINVPRSPSDFKDYYEIVKAFCPLCLSCFALAGNNIFGGQVDLVLTILFIFLRGGNGNSILPP